MIRKHLRRIIILAVIIIALPILLGIGGVIMIFHQAEVFASYLSYFHTSYSSGALSGEALSYVPGNLTAFTFFLLYESGGNYDRTGGDGGRACGAYQFDYQYELQPFLIWCYEKDPVTYMRFAPFLSVSKDSLRGSAALENAWHETYASHPQKFTADQDAYAYDTKYLPLQENIKQRFGIDLSTRPDVIKGEMLSMANRKGDVALYNAIERSGVNNQTSNEDMLIKICTAFATAPLDGVPRGPGNIVYDRWLTDGSSAACGKPAELTLALMILRDGTTASSASNPQSGVPNLTGINYGTGKGADVIRCASKYIGNPYVWGGNSLTKGCDCSHFVCLVLQECGYNYSYVTSCYWINYGVPVPDISKAIAGDVLVWDGHVGFYDGNGHLIEAQCEEVGITNYRQWFESNHPFLGIRRLV